MRLGHLLLLPAETSSALHCRLGRQKKKTATIYSYMHKAKGKFHNADGVAPISQGFSPSTLEGSECVDYQSLAQLVERFVTELP